MSRSERTSISYRIGWNKNPRAKAVFCSPSLWGVPHRQEEFFTTHHAVFSTLTRLLSRVTKRLKLKAASPSSGRCENSRSCLCSY